MRHPGAARSERAAALLRASGVEARALAGGVPAWAASGLPVDRGGEPGTPAPAAPGGVA